MTDRNLAEVACTIEPCSLGLMVLAWFGVAAGIYYFGHILNRWRNRVLERMKDG